MTEHAATNDPDLLHIVSPFCSPVLVAPPNSEFGTSSAVNSFHSVVSSQPPQSVVEVGDSSHSNEEEPLRSTYFGTPNGTRYWVPVVTSGFKPQVGMVFRDWEDVLSFYDSYAKKAGFSIRKGTLRKKKGEVRYRYLLCNKAGKPQRNHTYDSLNSSTLQIRRSTFSTCDCKACLKVRCLPGTTDFEIYGFVEAHNHNFVPSYNQDLTKQGRRLDFTRKQFIHQLSMHKVGPTKAHRLQVSLRGGHHNVQGTADDYKNFFQNIRMYIGDRDAQLVVEKLQSRADNGVDFSFYYNIVDGELRSLFWADEISKINYQLFGDVVAFDATYHTNRYDMIFVPFTGVDSHKRCVTFAAGLLYNETIESYTWLLECFLKAHGKQPTLVLTDQDPAMKQAVEAVLSESRHRLCMWHIMKKLPNKIPPEMFNNTDGRAKIHKLVWSVYNKPSTFEKQWADLVQAYGLEGNSWLSDMYSIRELWVPCYFREIQMCCLMKTTSRCESSNAAFKVNSSSGNTIVQFLLCFDTTIDQQRYSQRLSQFKTNSTSVDMLTGQNIEKHASLIYTQTIFKEVSKEIHKGMLVCFITNVDDVNGVKVYTVTQFNNINKEAELVHHFQVRVDITTETFACSCMCYTRIGYLCRHIFCVFRPFKIEKIPVKYIMDRWRRDAVPVSVFAVEKRYGVDFSEHSMVRIEVQDIVNECLDRLRDNHDKLLHFAESIRELKSELFSMLSKGDPSIKHDNQVISHLVGEPVSVNVECTNPHGIRNKGTRKSKRPVGHVEPEPVKPPKCPRKCKTCGEYVLGHDSRNCHKMRGSASAPPK